MAWGLRGPYGNARRPLHPSRWPARRKRAGPPAQRQSGRSSGVEHNLAKVGVEGSNPFARSILPHHGLTRVGQADIRRSMIDRASARPFWRPKIRTAAAMARLCRAQLLVSWIPVERWRTGLGCAEPSCDPSSVIEARRLAGDVAWAARRLPFATKCLPRAMALSWVLNRSKVPNTVVIAVRPDQLRRSPDVLHAWVEVQGEKILGDLPGPWIEAVRLGA